MMSSNIRYGVGDILVVTKTDLEQMATVRGQFEGLLPQQLVLSSVDSLETAALQHLCRVGLHSRKGRGTNTNHVLSGFFST